VNLKAKLENRTATLIVDTRNATRRIHLSEAQIVKLFPYAVSWIFPRRPQASREGPMSQRPPETRAKTWATP